MKKLQTPLLLIAAIVALTSCQRDKQLLEPAMGYIQAMADYRVADAAQYATNETQKYTLDFFLNNVMPRIDSAAIIQQNTPAKIYIDSVVYASDTAATVFFHKDTPIQKGIYATLDMRRRDGQWLAHQVLKPVPLLGGGFAAVDTAELKNRPLAPNGHPTKADLPKKIIVPSKE